MRWISFDLMGTDFGIAPGIEAVKKFTQNNNEYGFILVGPKSEILKYTQESNNIKIVDAPEPNIANLSLSVRQESNSMSVAIELINQNKAQAVISAGNSGLYLMLTTLKLKRLESIKRPAFMPILPMINNKKMLLLDAGANLEVTSEMLVQWAQIANSFSKLVLGISNPRIGLINIGTEENKGFNFVQEANKILKDKENLNYQGFIESRDLLLDKVDIAVVDGYGGNMVLKAIEGTGKATGHVLKTNLKSKLIYKIGALIAKNALMATANNFDYHKLGGAWIIGLNSLAMKVHGSSEKNSFLTSFEQIKSALENNIIESLKKDIVS